LKGLREIVETHDNSNKNYKAILYVGLEGSSRTIAKVTEDTTATTNLGLATGISIGGSLGGGIAGALRALSRLAFAIMTVNDEHFCFYILNKFSFTLDNIEHKTILPYEAINKLKIGKFFIWTNLKIHFTSRDKKYKLNVKISSKVVKLGSQEENIRILLDHLREKEMLKKETKKE
jgi:hypothetical protein